MSNRPSYREEVERMHAHERATDDYGWPRHNDQAAWRILGVFIVIIAVVVIALCVVGGICSTVKGAEFPLSPSTGKVIQYSNTGDQESYGSGVLVAKAEGIGCVLTAAHVVDAYKRHVVFFPKSNDFAYPVRAIHIQDFYEVGARKDFKPVDLCLVEIDAPLDIAPRSISWEPVNIGEKLWQSGYGNRNQGGPREYWSNVLPKIEYTATGKDEFKDPSLLLLSKPARQGDSGGPVIDAHARVVGIISSTDRQRGYHVTLSNQDWLKAILPQPEHSILVEQ